MPSERMGGRGELPSLALCLAEAAYQQGRLDDAERYATEATRLDAEDREIAAFAALSRAKVLARRGEREEAERLAMEASAVLSPWWARSVVAGTIALGRLDLAEVLRLCRKIEEASAVAHDALAVYERKEADGLAARARAFLDALQDEP